MNAAVATIQEAFRETFGEDAYKQATTDPNAKKPSSTRHKK